MHLQLLRELLDELALGGGVLRAQLVLLLHVLQHERAPLARLLLDELADLRPVRNRGERRPVRLAIAI